jgi:hypothetical protein
MNRQSAFHRPRPPFRRTPGLCLAAGLVLAGMAWGTARAEILINPRGWKFPNIITSAKEAIRVSDRTPLIPGKEVILKGYRKADGTRFMTYEIEGRVFGVEIDENGKPPFEYSILDTDGDGRFETKIVHGPGNTDRAYVPQWIIDYYYSLHPELKNPTVAQTMAPSPPNLIPPTPSASPAPRRQARTTGPPPPEVRERPNP